MHQRDLPSTSVNFPCGCRNFRKLSVHPWDLLSTFPTSAGPSVNLCQLSVHLRDHSSTSVHQSDIPSIPSNFRASAGLSVNFRQLSLRPQDLPPPSSNNLCICGTFRKCSVYLLNFLSISGNFPCSCGTFRQLSLRLRHIPKSCFSFLCGRETFRNFQYVAGSSVNFLSGHGSSGDFHPLSVQPRDFLSTSVNSLCGRGTVHKLLSLFRAAEGPSINVR